jgi:hypothetical protein
VFGTDADETFVGREAAKAEMGKDIARLRGQGILYTIELAKRDATVAPDGLSSWFVDEIDVVISEGGRVTKRVRNHVLSVLVKGDMGWQVVASHWSKDGEPPAEGAPETRALPEAIGPGAEALVPVAQAKVEGLSGVRAGLAPGGKVGWVAGTAKGQRALVVLVAKGEGWEVSRSHVSWPVADVPPPPPPADAGPIETPATEPAGAE